MIVPTSFEGRPTARPSASVMPSSPISRTAIASCRPVARPRVMQGAWVGSAKKICTFSPRSCFRPKATPPGAPPTPQGRYTNRGWRESTVTSASASCGRRRFAATEYPRKRSCEPSSSTKWHIGSEAASLRPSATAF